jgi:FkbM family methyltransferase
MIDWFRAKIKRLMAGSLGKCVYKLVTMPGALIRRPTSELRIDLDYVVAHRLLRKRDPSDFYFIQIGAFDGITSDPIHKFVVRYGWSGVLVEPQPEAFRALQETYKSQSQLTFLNVAIAHESGKKGLYRIRDGATRLPSWSQQVASFDLDTVLKHGHDLPASDTRGIPNIEKLVEIEQVNCITFDALLRELGVEEIDLLQIDVEGYDFEIIKMVDFERIKPWIICYEHIHLSQQQQKECIEHLTRYGYLVSVDFADTIAYLG